MTYLIKCWKHLHWCDRCSSTAPGLWKPRQWAQKATLSLAYINELIKLREVQHLKFVFYFRNSLLYIFVNTSYLQGDTGNFELWVFPLGSPLTWWEVMRYFSILSYSMSESDKTHQERFVPTHQVMTQTVSTRHSPNSALVQVTWPFGYACIHIWSASHSLSGSFGLPGMQQCLRSAAFAPWSVFCRLQCRKSGKDRTTGERNGREGADRRRKEELAYIKKQSGQEQRFVFWEHLWRHSVWVVSWTMLQYYLVL